MTTDAKDYGLRLRAVSDALRLLQEGPPPTEEQRGHNIPLMGGYISHSSEGPDPRYAEISLALDVARFLIDEEISDDEEDR